MKTKKIMLWGWYGFENLGDDLLLDTMLSNLSASSRMLTVPMKVMYDIKDEKVRQIKRNYNELLKGVVNHDVLIIGPGGLFPFDNPKKVMIYFWIILLWRIFRRKVMFFGIGISERMSSLSIILWRIIANLSNLFITRSTGIIDKFKIKKSSNIYTMADAVFASELRFEECPGEERIGIFAANLSQERMETKYAYYIKVWQEIVKVLLDKGFYVDLFAFSKGTDDRMITDIAKAFENRGGGTGNPVRKCA